MSKKHAAAAFCALIVTVGVALPTTANAQTSPSVTTAAKLVATLSYGQKTLIDFAVSPDGETVATACADGVVRLWSARTGELRSTLSSDHKYRWMKIRWSPDGKTLVTTGGGGNGGPQIWDLASGKLKAELAARDILSIDFSPDGRMLMTNKFNDRFVNLWDAETGIQRATLEHASACPKQSFLKSVITNRPCQPPLYVTGAFDTEGVSVITASIGHPAKLWDATAGKLKELLPPQANGSDDLMYQGDLVLSPDRRLVARYIDTEVALLNTSTGEIKQRLGQIGLPIAFSPDSKILLTRISEPPARNSVNAEFRLYEVATGKLLLTFERPKVTSLRRFLLWSSDGSTILVGSGSAELLDARTGKVKGKLDLGSCTPDSWFGDDGCQPFTLSADGRFVIKVKDPLRLWSNNGELVTTLDAAKAPAAFSPVNPRILITRSKDKKAALVWEIQH